MIVKASAILLGAFHSIFITQGAFAAQPAQSPRLSEEAFFQPHQYQFDLELVNNSLFDDDSSIVRRREDSVRGSALHLDSDLGVQTLQMPTMRATFWFDELNAAQFQFRYLALYGSSALSTPVTFNGDSIVPGQRINTDGTTWFTAGLFYERRISPWLEPHIMRWPEFLQHWELRPTIGIEFVYLDFQINNGHPNRTAAGFVERSTSVSLLDARGRWHDQELPVPTIGIELLRELDEHLAIEITAQGAWINKWNSLRTQGGTVYLSQSTFETHWRAVWNDPALLWGLRPFLGWTYYYYKQTETSGIIGNLIRLQSYGPEVGLEYAF